MGATEKVAIVGLGILALAGGRKRRGGSSSVSHDLPSQDRLAVDVTIQDEAGNILFEQEDVPSGGFISAPNRTAQGSAGTLDAADDADDQTDGGALSGGEPSITIGEITVTPTTNGSPPPPTLRSGSAPRVYDAARLKLAADKFVAAWVANGKRPLPASQEYLVSAVQLAATNVTVDGDYGPITAGVVQFARSGLTTPPPWRPTGSPVRWSPPR